MSNPDREAVAQLAHQGAGERRFSHSGERAASQQHDAVAHPDLVIRPAHAGREEVAGQR